MKINLKDANNLLASLTTLINDATVKEGYEIRLPKFGTFKSKVNPAGLRRNVKTGEKIQVAESIKLQFKASAANKKSKDGEESDKE